MEKLKALAGAVNEVAAKTGLAPKQVYALGTLALFIVAVVTWMGVTALSYEAESEMRSQAWEAEREARLNDQRAKREATRVAWYKAQSTAEAGLSEAQKEERRRVREEAERRALEEARRNAEYSRRSTDGAIGESGRGSGAIESKLNYASGCDHELWMADWRFELEDGRFRHRFPDGTYEAYLRYMLTPEWFYRCHR